MTLAERLIVAADFKTIDPGLEGNCRLVRKEVLKLASSLRGTGVCLKVNSALRACGYDLIDEIHSRGLKVFADLKLFDIGETLSTDGLFLREVKPDLLTVVCSAGVSALQMLKAELPNTEVLGVTVLTSLKKEDVQEMYGGSIEEAVSLFAMIALNGKADGLIASPKEAEMLRARFENALTINTPAIRPTWAIVAGDDQNPDRIMTPEKAIKAGADRIIVGRPIVRDKNPYDAVMRTIEEIARATA